MHPQIPRELVTVPLESAQHTYITTILVNFILR